MCKILSEIVELRVERTLIMHDLLSLQRIIKSEIENSNNSKDNPKIERLYTEYDTLMDKFKKSYAINPLKLFVLSRVINIGFKRNKNK